MSRDPWDLDDLDNHHPPCPGGCNQLADECMCARPNPFGSMRIDGAFPAAVEHLCERDLQVHSGSVEDCCVAEWRAEGVAP